MKVSTIIGFSILQWVITLLVPFILVITAVRILMTPLFLQIEYRMPGFPTDSYGFTQADRLQWAPFAVDYLVNSAGISYIGDLRFADGTPLYNDLELSHMLDVKNLVQVLLKLWLAGLAVLLILGLWAWRSRWLAGYRRALSRGGWITVGLVVAILAAVVVSFNALFIGFHELFFTQGNWQFYYSDTLIRLFPIRFWQDCFIAVGGLSLLGGLALGLLLRKKTAGG
jgi:integral membrane protein (TIGR01906 family)